IGFAVGVGAARSSAPASAEAELPVNLLPEIVIPFKPSSATAPPSAAWLPANVLPVITVGCVATVPGLNCVWMLIAAPDEEVLAPFVNVLAANVAASPGS